MRYLGMVGFVLLIGAGIWLVREGIEGQRLREALARESQAIATATAEVRKSAREQIARAEAAEKEVARLQAVAAFLATPPNKALTNLPIRLEEIGRLVSAERYPEALAGYLNLYGELGGLKERERVALGVCMIAMTGECEPALQAAYRMRDEAWRGLRAEPDHPLLPSEIAVISLRLEEPHELLPVWDFLPKGDARRGSIEPFIQPALVDARRYEEALEVRPFASMVAGLESTAASLASQSEPTFSRRRGQMAVDAARGIEALVGIGRREEAQVLTDKLLAIDPSEATRRLVQQRRARAEAHF